MASKANPKLVGGFVVGAVALLAATVALFGGGNLLVKHPRAGTYFHGSVAGLVVGAPVTYQGVRIGEVKAIRLEMDSATLDARMPVEFELIPGSVQWTDRPLNPDEYRRLIDKGLRAKLVQQSFVTGLLAVELGYHPETPAALVGGLPKSVEEIPSVQSDLESLKATLSDLPLARIAALATQTLERFNALLGMPELKGGVVSLADGLQQFSALAGGINERSGPLLDDAQRLAGEAGTALADLRGLIQAVNGEVRPLGAHAQGALATAEKAFRQADTTLRQADEALRAVDDAVDRRSALRSNLDQTLANLAAASKSLRSFADQVDRRPNVVITGR
ncbi:MlaD family protein [Azospirillum doebereinerae]